MIASPYATYTADRGHGEPIGTLYEITEPAGLAYWAPDEWIDARTTTRRAMACRWSPPTPPAAPMTDAEFFAAMFGDSAE